MRHALIVIMYVRYLIHRSKYYKSTVVVKVDVNPWREKMKEDSQIILLLFLRTYLL